MWCIWHHISQKLKSSSLRQTAVTDWAHSSCFQVNFPRICFKSDPQNKGPTPLSPSPCQNLRILLLFQLHFITFWCYFSVPRRSFWSIVSTSGACKGPKSVTKWLQNRCSFSESSEMRFEHYFILPHYFLKMGHKKLHLGSQFRSHIQSPFWKC